MRRIVSVWLTDWPITVWSAQARRSPPPDGAPFAIVESGAHGITLRALNRAARAVGLRVGQGQADARAMIPHLIAMPAEPERERARLERLGHWCERWSPAVALDLIPVGYEGLLLDVTGVAHLFGGESGLVADMSRAFARARIPAQFALADTPGAAWGLARFSRRRATIVAPGDAKEALAVLPVAALRVSTATLTLARRFGLKRIADLHPLPRAKLARRFRDGDGLGLVRRLDQLCGDEPEPLDPLRATPVHSTRRIFAEPLTDLAGIAAQVPALADTLAAALEQDAMGARGLTLVGFCVDGGVTTLHVRLGAPSRDVRIWLRLLTTRGIDRLDPGFGIDALMLSADPVEPVALVQPALDGAEEAVTEPLPDLIDRLSARLGPETILTARLARSWLPERAERWGPAQLAPDAAPDTMPPRRRPVLLLDPPETIETTAEIPEGAPIHFTWRRVGRRVMRAQGPERLSREWWRRTRSGTIRRTRDYYRVEDEQGIGYWLFREGLYDWEDEAGSRPPTWWMHGLFG